MSLQKLENVQILHVDETCHQEKKEVINPEAVCCPVLEESPEECSNAIVAANPSMIAECTTKLSNNVRK